MSNAQDQSGPAQDYVEIGVAIATAIFGIIVIIGSVMVGHGWSSSGPQSGFLPFYFGLLIVVGSLINLWNVYSEADYKALFAEWGQLRQVMKVVVPTTIYVALVPNIGIYLSSFLLIAVFMRWIGDYGWRKTLILSATVPLVAFVVFERWFLVSLPKGPVEAWLGF